MSRDGQQKGAVAGRMLVQNLEFRNWLSRDEVARNPESSQLPVGVCLCIPIKGKVR